MLKRAEPFLKHILEEIEYLQKKSNQLKYEDFISDEDLKRSFVRSLEVIGEATKNLPQDFRNKHTQVQWKDIAGLRDVLIHRYFGVDYKSVWDIIKNKIPELKRQIEKILSEAED